MGREGGPVRAEIRFPDTSLTGHFERVIAYYTGTPIRMTRWYHDGIRVLILIRVHLRMHSN